MIAVVRYILLMGKSQFFTKISFFTMITLWWTNKKLWKITIFNAKIHYEWSFSIAMLVHQRVKTTSCSMEIPAELADSACGVARKRAWCRDAKAPIQ